MNTKTLIHRVTLISALLAASFTNVASAQTPTDAPKPAVNRITGAAPDASWEEEYAYALGTTAYVHLFPWMFFSQIRYVWAMQGRQNMQTPQTPPNVLSRTVGLSDHRHNEGGRPNVDTLYSFVKQRPIAVLAAPTCGPPSNMEPRSCT